MRSNQSEQKGHESPSSVSTQAPQLQDGSPHSDRPLKTGRLWYSVIKVGHHSDRPAVIKWPSTWPLWRADPALTWCQYVTDRPLEHPPLWTVYASHCPTLHWISTELFIPIFFLAVDFVFFAFLDIFVIASEHSSNTGVFFKEHQMRIQFVWAPIRDLYQQGSFPPGVRQHAFNVSVLAKPGSAAAAGWGRGKLCFLPGRAAIWPGGAVSQPWTATYLHGSLQAHFAAISQQRRATVQQREVPPKQPRNFTTLFKQQTGHKKHTSHKTTTMYLGLV